MSHPATHALWPWYVLAGTGIHGKPFQVADPFSLMGCAARKRLQEPSERLVYTVVRGPRWGDGELSWHSSLNRRSIGNEPATITHHDSCGFHFAPYSELPFCLVAPGLRRRELKGHSYSATVHVMYFFWLTFMMRSQRQFGTEIIWMASHHTLMATNSLAGQSEEYVCIIQLLLLYTLVIEKHIISP